MVKCIAKARELRPDIILLDITLPDMDGIEVTRQICAAWSEAKVLALTMHSEDVYLVPFLEAGGVGYVRKSAADRDVLNAIKTILAGETFISQVDWKPSCANTGPQQGGSSSWTRCVIGTRAAWY